MLCTRKARRDQRQRLLFKCLLSCIIQKRPPLSLSVFFLFFYIFYLVNGNLTLSVWTQLVAAEPGAEQSGIVIVNACRMTVAVGSQVDFFCYTQKPHSHRRHKFQPGNKSEQTNGFNNFFFLTKKVPANAHTQHHSIVF